MERRAEGVARGDLLVAVHLSLDLVRDCCVLAMALRDRETGTDHHREGLGCDAYMARLPHIKHPYNAANILDSLEESAAVFDMLACRWSDSCPDCRKPLLCSIRQARDMLGC